MLECKVLPWSGADAGLMRDWQAIVARRRFNQTLGPGWFSVSSRTVAERARNLSLFVCSKQCGTHVVVLPFFFSNKRMFGLNMRVLEIGSNLMSYHAELITDGPPQEPLQRFMNTTTGWDVLHIANVPVESATARAIRDSAGKADMFLQAVPGDESPYLELGGTWGDYLATRSKKFRYKLRRRRELIEKTARCGLRWFVNPEETADLLRDILQVEERSWKTAAHIGIASRATEREYHRQLLDYLAAEGAMLANVLYVGRQPIAYSLCCSFNGWIGHLKTSFDQAFSEISPGAFVIDACVEKAFDVQAREFDFLGAAASHKLAWTPQTRRHADFFVFSGSPRSKLVGALKAMKSGLSGRGGGHAMIRHFTEAGRKLWPVAKRRQDV